MLPLMAHRIILFNFTEKEASIIAKAGYNVERGFVGVVHGDGPSSYLPFYAPHPPYDYDILFYNSYISADVEKEFASLCRNLIDAAGAWDAFRYFRTPPQVRVSFIGSPNGAHSLIQGGIGFVALTKAEENVSSFLEMPSDGAFSIEILHDLIAGFAGQVESVGKFYSIAKQPGGTGIYPFNTFPVLISRNHSCVAGYGTTYNQGTVPRYIILPKLKNLPHGAIEVLKCLEDVSPELFPDKVKRDWLQSDEFLLPQEKAIEEEVNQRIAEVTRFLGSKKLEREKFASENFFVREILVATEDTKREPAKRLSQVIKTALEFLGFRVENIDEKTKSAIKKEDFWVIDGTFLAITEVTGTVNKNPKIKEFNDILGRLTTIYKRRSDLILPEGLTVDGLLVLNHDIDTHPAKRPIVYSGDDQHIVEAAVEHGIGILSTVELHRIVVAVMENRLSKDAARAMIRKPGRIEFDAHEF
jgi:hypothetical protein